jgi:imidazole glycerol phosphate synthase glutamine amidotransferase subunit
MSKLTIGIVDYDVGNLASVRHTLQALGYRHRVSCDPEALDQTDLVLLPGVGAFPHAMKSLHVRGLDQFIRDRARHGKPVVGICLGMQLLADSSAEVVQTAGLGLIPGQVTAFTRPGWHIGWNNIEVIQDDPLFKGGDGLSVYFNHSYVFHAAPEYQVAIARFDSSNMPFPIAVRRDNVVGLQFHPEKSQQDGRQLLANVVEGLCRA